MWAAIIAAISNGFSAAGAWIGLIKQRDSEKNTAAMQAGITAQVEQSAIDKTNAAIAAKDVKEIRNELAE